VEPATTALLAIELKRVTVGDLQASSPDGAPGNPLGSVAAEQHLVPRLAELARAARAAGVRVVHCTAAFREDGAGSAANAPIRPSTRRQPLRATTNTGLAQAGRRRNINSSRAKAATQEVPSAKPNRSRRTLRRRSRER